ncbi:carbohydrate kinase family protein [Clostridium gasigenes]|uniref:carbohydrate kinase family protein n=1 Tax=Clostridium gasigenes TaxID=94869 RepID=UPI00143861A3|nr:carbohydrate kinase [Clostridium gasigenes]MBU3105460.1 carbohydrate kinase [Clostridium gasigenes]NKF05624.1 carbohydrate kinase [Clostridium gasigenes]QSW19063.1 carbohydrate kinase [Clostridium gasigenes]
MYDVVALGELLIDFTPSGKSGQNNSLFEANPGGAPCNVLSMLSKCKKSTAFIGKVGDDIFGHLLKETIGELGIDSRGLKMSSEVNTTLAFVQIDETGDRNFAFYRNPGADMKLTEGEVDESIIKDTKIFHFGTLSMTHDDVRKATKKAISIAKENRILISFDPNLREPLWRNMEDAIEQMKFGCSVCDILKIEDKELEIITGYEKIDDGVKSLQEQYDINLIMVTSGAYGSRAYSKDMMVFKKAFITDKTVDTTGAGDTFCGACLSYILDNGLKNLNEEKLGKMLTFSNAAASIVTTRKGAIKSMPEIEEVEEYIKSF